MVCRRTIVLFGFALLPAFAGEWDRMVGRWRSRITVVRSGRPLHSRLRIAISAAGGAAVEEFTTGGALAWIYKGTLRMTADQELLFEVQSVTDPNGTVPEEGRARYQAGETYNLGAVDYLSPARIRVGALELQKELE